MQKIQEHGKRPSLEVPALPKERRAEERQHHEHADQNSRGIDQNLLKKEGKDEKSDEEAVDEKIYPKKRANLPEKQSPSLREHHESDYKRSNKKIEVEVAQITSPRKEHRIKESIEKECPQKEKQQKEEKSLKQENRGPDKFSRGKFQKGSVPGSSFELVDTPSPKPNRDKAKFEDESPKKAHKNNEDSRRKKSYSSPERAKEGRERSKSRKMHLANHVPGPKGEKRRDPPEELKKVDRETKEKPTKQREEEQSPISRDKKKKKNIDKPEEDIPKKNEKEEENGTKQQKELKNEKHKDTKESPNAPDKNAKSNPQVTSIRSHYNRSLSSLRRSIFTQICTALRDTNRQTSITSKSKTMEKHLS